jgi:hypothetical protein
MVQKAPLSLGGFKATTTHDFASDGSAILRTLSDVSDAFVANGRSNMLGTSMTSAEYGILGATTGVSAVQGAAKVKIAMDALKESARIGNAEGCFLDGSYLAFGAAQAVAGAAMVPVRANGVASGLNCTSKSLTQTATQALQVAMPAWGFFYFCAIVLSGGYFWKSQKFSSEWNATNGALKAQLEILNRYLKVDAVCEDKKKEAISFVARKLQIESEELIALGKPREMDAKEWDGFVKKTKRTSQAAWKELAKIKLEKPFELAHLFKELGLDLSKENAIEELGQIAFDARQKEILKDSLGRVIGAEALQAVLDAQKTGLLERLNHNEEAVRKAAYNEMSHFVLKVEKGLSWSWYLNLLGTMCGVVLLPPIILGYLMQDPLTNVIVNVINLVGYGLMTALDFGFLWKDLASEGPIGAYDKKTIACLLGLAVLMTVLGVGLSIASGGAFPIAAAVIIGALWIAPLVYSYLRLDEKDRNYRANHPFLEDFAKKLEEPGLDLPKALDMLNKLPTVQKEKILEQILKQSNKAPQSEVFKKIASLALKDAEPVTIAKAFENAYPKDPLINNAYLDLYKKLDLPSFKISDEEKIKRIKLIQKTKENVVYEAIYDQIAKQMREDICLQIENVEALKKALQGAEKALKEETAKKIDKWDGELRDLREKDDQKIVNRLLAPLGLY